MQKHFKKLLALLLALTMAVGAVPSVFAAEPETLTGTVEYFSTDNRAFVEDTYTYSDAWFFEDPAERNDALALLSMQLVAAATDEGKGADFLSKLGFTASGSVTDQAENPADCGYIWGTKTISDGSDTATLVAIAFPSFSMDTVTTTQAWVQNFTVNFGETVTPEHFAYMTAVNQIVNSILALGGNGSVKYWITGFSRTGALANILATKLLQTADVFAYTFEAPATVESAYAVPSPSIHNYICTDDLVVFVPPWGMVRHGEDVFLFDKAETQFHSLLSALMMNFPQRKDYSAAQTESIPFIGPVSYCYQDIFAKLAGLVALSVRTGSAGTDLLGSMSTVKLVDLIENLAKNDPATTYIIAGSLHQKLNDSIANFPLTVNELYGFLKLAAPLCIDPGYVFDETAYPLPIGADEETIAGIKLMGYLSPLYQYSGMINKVLLSHSFDTEIKRLKELVYGPLVKNRIDEIEINFDFPREGEDSREDRLTLPADALYHVDSYTIMRKVEDGFEGVYENLPAEELSLVFEIVANDVSIVFDREGYYYAGSFKFNGEELDSECYRMVFADFYEDQDPEGVYAIEVSIPFTPGSAQESEDTENDFYNSFRYAMAYARQRRAAEEAAKKAAEEAAKKAAEEAAKKAAEDAANTPEVPEIPLLPFADVTAENPYLTAINYVFSSGIMNGVSTTAFDPYGTLTRAMFVTILGRLDQIDPADYSGSTFTDCDAIGEWDYAPYVEWAAQNGIVLGYGDGTFGPMDPVTNEQAILMLHRYAAYLGYEDDSAVDFVTFPEGTTVSPWAADAVAWAYANSIYPNETDAVPTEPGERGWMAQVIYNFVGFLIR